MSSDRQRELFDVAQEQGGYFTAKQAARLGYSANKRHYHVGAGNWVREYRGIYRLALFPTADRPDLILWWLWSRGRDDRPAGVFSHRTALSLHDLTDVNPAKIDLTVPPSFRKGSAIPAVLHLYYAPVQDSDREVIAGVPVTTPLRTIVDVWAEGIMPKTALRAAFAEAMRRGSITRRQVDQARKRPELAELVSELEGRKR